MLESKRPQTVSTQMNACFQLALNCLQDWDYLETIKKAIVFPRHFHAKAQDIINGLTWLNDAAELGHDDVLSYLDRVRQTLIPAVTRQYSEEEFIDLLCENEFSYLVDLLLPQQDHALR